MEKNRTSEINKHKYGSVYLLLILLLVLLFINTILHSQSNGYGVLVVQINGEINSATSEQIRSAINYAQTNNDIVVIELNTPGGDLDSTLEITQDILQANTLVVGYVVGTWAESAGTLIFLSTHVSAMQPQTQIGSVQPVELLPSGQVVFINDSKIINAIAQRAQLLASLTGKNTTAAQLFVTVNLNLNATQAVKYHVANFIANSLTQLINLINGHTFRLPSSNSSFTFIFNGNVINYNPPIYVQILNVLNDPIISGLLSIAGTILLLAGLFLGDAVILVPLGLSLIILSLISQGLNENYAGIILAIIGISMIIAEIASHATFHGIGLAIGGILIFSGVMLIPLLSINYTTPSYLNTIFYTFIGISIIFGALGIFMGGKIISARRRRSLVNNYIGKVGIATEDIRKGKEGYINIEGELWRATSDEDIERGMEVIVIDQQGFKLKVKKLIR